MSESEPSEPEQRTGGPRWVGPLAIVVGLLLLTLLCIGLSVWGP